MTIQSEADRKEIKDAMDEISASKTRVGGERTFQSEAIKALADKFTLDKKLLRKMAKVHHDTNFASVSAEQEEFEMLYDDVFKPSESV